MREWNGGEHGDSYVSAEANAAKGGPERLPARE